ncbi:MAG: GntR family transcriptional regulator [Alistipes sp.]|nr:GntR family transcriptional regulator [Alistipes sp.]
MITQDDTTPIFLQIKRWIEDYILRDEWSADTQLPSVRELAAEFGVNPNTVARTYERLTLDGTVRSARGIGFFVSENAKEAIVSRRREEFVAKTLPSFIEQMRLLDIGPKEIINAYNNYKDENRN